MEFDSACIVPFRELTQVAQNKDLTIWSPRIDGVERLSIDIQRRRVGPPRSVVL